ncbi:hypothetical protein ABIB94_008085 [Bradyrhizobium sp. JR7.2]
MSAVRASERLTAKFGGGSQFAWRDPANRLLCHVDGFSRRCNIQMTH